MIIMLNKNDLLKDVEEIYIPMLKEVNIPDFTKCIAQFSGLKINDVDDNVIKEYLITWAKNKYRFYKMLGDKIKIDKPITYKDESIDFLGKLKELERCFPVYALWLEGFRYAESNKIYERNVRLEVKEMIDKLFPECRLNGCLMTHFFKQYLKAPDALVTEIGRIWENQEVEGTHTISIDPVDMMFASENPYDWTSCYRLETFDGGSHADGCLAAILDNSSLITYIWNREGKFSLYNKYDFKSIRYYRMRQWISIAPTNTAIHFNAIYPGKTYSDSLEKLLRSYVENVVNKEATWILNETYDTDVNRGYDYGYDEFHSRKIFKIKDSEDVSWTVYNKEILCPCGCGDVLPGSDPDEYDDEGYEYNGEGFIRENFYEMPDPDAEYCEYIEDYCENYEDCYNCVHWNRCNPVCELDTDTRCEYSDDAEANNEFNPYDTNVVPCGGHCEGCPHYEEHIENNE